MMGQNLNEIMADARSAHPIEPDTVIDGFDVIVNDLVDICPDDGLSAVASDACCRLDVTPYPASSGRDPHVQMTLFISDYSMADVVRELHAYADKLEHVYDKARKMMADAHPDWDYPD